MTTNPKNRAKGMDVVIPILYGSSARLVLPEDNATDPSHTHQWKVYFRGVDGQGNIIIIPDLSPYIAKVEFKLHESFAEPIRTIVTPPYEVVETGWGEFEIVIKIILPDVNEKILTVQHHLQLHPGPIVLDNPSNPSKYVVNEHYDEIVLSNLTIDFS
jgi:YEATS domain-containing protein 4